jgi:hypothetical protein
MRIEQANHPGHEPTPAEIEAWAVDAVKEVKLRGTGETVRAYTLTPEQARDEKVVIPEQEAKFRAWFIPTATARSRKNGRVTAPTDAAVREAYVNWLAIPEKDRPEIPAPPPSGMWGEFK